ncbi:MAG: ABC transporter permease [Lachnospiraceae bacterium]|nr:ABC transporter permease [Lachnospiraceae bacterium]
MNQNKKEPLFRITKRTDIPPHKSWIIRGVAIVIALLVCAIITTLLTKANPIEVYSSIITGAFGTTRKTWITLQNLSILLLISLALTPAFRMRFWNIGGEGQILMGGLATAACMKFLPGVVPNGLLILIMLLAGIIAGGIWGLIPGVLKAKWNTNETLSTLMMNYIATQIVAAFILYWSGKQSSGKIGVINPDDNLGWLPKIGGIAQLLPVIIAIIITIVSYIYYNYTKQGYEIAVVGESDRTAKYVGMNVKKVIIRTMFISGALCGLVGFLLVGGVNHTVTTTIAGGQGFTAVMVSWLAKFNPFAMIFSSFLIIFMGQGAGEIATAMGLDSSISDILTGIILFFVIACEFFISYKVTFKNNKKEEA